ncbi:Ketose-bisphosphate aldolase, class-II [mine drainage metagenome]|uniref:Ketose-bisphosphate aldolase, class-II n=1 Tax=mine drainage metagenome TaxID=410659 RepID=T1C920_9ZZZZ
MPETHRMALVSLRQVLDHAAEHGYGVPAFNINDMEQIQAIMEAAQEVQAPVILQASAGARGYAGEAYLRHMVLAAIETHPDIPVVLHQDHGATPAVCQASIRSGFSSVMMDGSLLEDAKTPARMSTTSRSRARCASWRTGWACRWKASWVAWVRWKPARPARKTASVPPASSATTCC